MGDVLDLDDIHVEFATDLVTMVLDPATGLDARIANMRRHVATVFGLILPEIRLTDDPGLPPGTYVVRIQGVEQARDILQPNRVLAILTGGPVALPPGDDVEEPVYGAPARWVPADAQEDVALQGCTAVTPAEVLATHLLEVMKRNFGRLLSMRALRRLLDEFTNLSDPIRAEANKRLLDELVPDRVPVDLLLSVLRLLLEERVSMRRELSALVARSPFGQGAAWPVVETVQRDGICVTVLAPAPGLSGELAAEAEQLGLRLADELGVVGVLAVELFETTDGALLVNELAPRPHNSGHWTIDACATSQFEQFVRAIVGLPLAPIGRHADAVMTNLLGDDVRQWPRLAADPETKLHLYGKAEARPGRKMGHVNRITSTRS